MIRLRLLIPMTVVAGIVLAGCDEAPEESSAPSQDASAAATSGSDAAGAGSDAGSEADEGADGDGVAGDGAGPEGSGSSGSGSSGAVNGGAGDGGAGTDGAGTPAGDLPVSDTDPHGGAGPDDGQVSYPATDSPLAPECPVLPAHPMPHTVVSADAVEGPGGLECTTVIDSRGDGLHLAELIAEQLEAAGHEMTSRPPGDSSADSVNTMSYLIGTDELHVTVRQTGVSGAEVHYFLAPARGNG